VSEAAKMPTGPVQGARFGGLLEGRVGDRLALERAVQELREKGPVVPTLEVEGARFCLYLDDAVVSPSLANPERMLAFLGGLKNVASAAKQDSPIESTLRCTEVYPEEAVETHFGLDGGEITAVSRVRERGASDRLPEPPPTRLLPTLGNGSQRILLASSFALVIVLMLWQGRVVDRVLGSPVEDLTSSTGPFGSMLRVELEEGFGAYRLLLSRGEGYPLTGADVARLEDRAASPMARAAITAVADGLILEARVVDADGEVLASKRAGTAALLLDGGFTIELALPARIGATSVELEVVLPTTLREATR
jgi:hypothetical protein